MSTSSLAHLLVAAGYAWAGALWVILLHRLWSRSRRGSLVFIGLVGMAYTCAPHHFEWGLHLLSTTATQLDTFTIMMAVPMAACWVFWQTAAVFSERPNDPRTGLGRRFHPGFVYLSERWPKWWRSDWKIRGNSLIVPALFVTLIAYCTAIVVTSQPDAWSGPTQVQAALVGLYLIVSLQWWAGQFRRRQIDGEWSAKGIVLAYIWATCAMSHWARVVALGDGIYQPNGHLLLLGVISIPVTAGFIGSVWWLQRPAAQDPISASVLAAEILKVNDETARVLLAQDRQAAERLGAAVDELLTKVSANTEGIGRIETAAEGVAADLVVAQKAVDGVAADLIGTQTTVRGVARDLLAVQAVDNEEQHRLKHAALNRITVLEGTLHLVANDMKKCTCGALSGPVSDLLDQVI